MGEALSVEAVLTAMRQVVRTDVVVEAGTPLDQTTLDSLGLLEVMVHLEQITGATLDEETVRAIALDPDYDSGMSVAAFALLIQRMTTDREAAP